MKRILSVLLIIAMLIPLASCANDVNNVEQESTSALITDTPRIEDSFVFEKGTDGGYVVTSFSTSDQTPHTVTIPASYNGLAITAIGKELAKGSTAISELVIPDSVTVIEDGAFANCSSLKKIDMSESIERIGGGAFNNCDLLETVELPWNVTLGQGAFADCDTLDKKIYVPKEDEVLNILMVGNSFCYYYPDELFGLAKEKTEL